MCVMFDRMWVHSAVCYATLLFRFVASGNETIAVKSNAVTYVESRDIVPSGSGTRWRRSLSQQEIESVTSVHNTLRRLEGASNMEYMKWSDRLASLAQQWADGCDFVHGQPPYDPSTLPYRGIGQNLYATTGSLDAASAIRSSWYDEKQYFDYDSLYCQPGKPCGHYTQIVWASSRELGCAYSSCQNLRHTSLGKSNYLVCNYGPPGNYLGQKPYKRGRACSNCEGEVYCCYDGLCNSAEDNQPVTCSAPNSNRVMSLSIISVTMTFVAMASLICRR